MPSIPRTFLEQLADRYRLTPEFEKPTFIEKIEHIEKSDIVVAKILNISRDRYSTRMTRIYQKFNISGNAPGKAKILYLKVLDLFQKEYPSDARSLDIISDAINNLVKNVQEKTRRQIFERCGYMQILDMSRPIDVQEIFTEVKITDQLTSKRRLEIADLVKEIQNSELTADRNIQDSTQDIKSISEKKFSGIDLVKHTHKLILFGKPGAGKTTFLKYIAVLINRSEIIPDIVPVFISLKDFQDQEGNVNLRNYIFDFFKRASVLEDEVNRLLIHSKIIFLLDGLDEVSDAYFSDVIKQIKELSQYFSHNKFIITCRLAAHEYKFENFIEAEVCDFTSAQIKSFVRSWFSSQQKPKRATRFLDRIKNEPKIRELSSNPLLLTLLCIVFGDSGDFPRNRAELYEEGLDVLLRKWDASRDIDRHQAYQGLSKSKKEDLLSQIAYVTFEENEGFFKQKMIENEIRNYIYNLPSAIRDPSSIDPDCKAILRSIVSQHGLILEVAKGIYSFSHRTFHEFFVSRKIVKTLAEDQKIILDHLAERINDHRWGEVFLLVACTIQNADPLVLLIKNKIDSILEEEENPKQFISWLHRKTMSINILKSPNASDAPISSVSQVFYFNLVVESKASTSIMNQEFIIDSELISMLNHALFLKRSSDLISNLSDQRKIDEVKSKQNSTHDVLTLTMDRFCKRISNSLLKEKLEHLYSQLPCASTVLKEWWIENGENWISRLRSVLMQNRDIGHDWNFTQHDLATLRNYYNANKILSYCLNSDCYVSRNVREEIRKSTLLPMDRAYLDGVN